MGQARRQLVEAVGVEALERLTRPAMQLAAPRGQERRLGDILGQRVPEGIDDLLADRALEEELQSRELTEVGLDRGRAVPDRREKRGGELAAEDRRRLEGALGVLVQPVDARGEDAVHGVRDGEVRPDLLVAHGPGQLLEEERIAFRLVEDQPGERVAGARGGQDRLDDGEALVRGQAAERDLGRE